MSIQKKPAARHIQPTGFSGRLEAIRAPTTGKARKGTKTNRSSRMSELTRACSVNWARTYSATLATNMATERAASDQASHTEVRALTLAAPRPYSQTKRDEHSH